MQASYRQCAKGNRTMEFKEIRLATGETHLIPADLELREPQETQLDPERRHFVFYIPWDDKYLANIDPEYRAFFQEVLPYLHARTTDVHITQCVPFISELI